MPWSASVPKTWSKVYVFDRPLPCEPSVGADRVPPGASASTCTCVPRGPVVCSTCAFSAAVPLREKHTYRMRTTTFIFASPPRRPSAWLADTVRCAALGTGCAAPADTTRAGRTPCVRRTDAMPSRSTRGATRWSRAIHPKPYGRVLLEPSRGEQRKRGMHLRQRKTYCDRCDGISMSLEFLDDFLAL